VHDRQELGVVSKRMKGSEQALVAKENNRGLYATCRSWIRYTFEEDVTSK
jgi:hypothetical protein